MIKELELDIKPSNIENDELIKSLALKKLKIDAPRLKGFVVLRRSIDSRKKLTLYKLRIRAFIDEEPKELFQPENFSIVTGKTRNAAIIGFGPAGMFAALKLLQNNIQPVIFERGKDVQLRRRDLRAIQQDGIVNPDSNYCFGEGGAGTYSDGKLYTRSTKRGSVKRILNLLVQHGADKDIMVDAHPHIGSNKLPKVVNSIRETIINNGGEIHFESKLTDINISDGKLKSIIVNDKDEFEFDALILATGHSARDIYYLLHKRNVRIEAKSFAMGVRIEHPQPLIDSIQYNCEVRPDNLPAATYSLNTQIEDRGVYSFCMCPGGIIVPSATAPGEIVLNGMSVSRRDSPFANSGLVVTVEDEDILHYKKHGVFAGLEFQKKLERDAFETAEGSQKAPAQRLTDFVKRQASDTLPDTSYIPGVFPYRLDKLLPKSIAKRIALSMKVFSKTMRGYYTEESQLLAPETRTSSPIRIVRTPDTYMHPEVEGLFPAGEGAGYAGGIVSAAIDGENSASKVAEFLKG